jgi:hypothetical protein
MDTPLAVAQASVGRRTFPVDRRRFAAVCGLAPWLVPRAAHSVPSAQPPNKQDVAGRTGNAGVVAVSADGAAAGSSGS